MNNKIKLIAKETSATNRDFYNLFRPIAPSIDMIGKVAQVISALTEAVTIWHISQSELAGSSKIVATLVSIVATILVVAVLELGGRKFLQVATRALVWKRFKNKWYIALFAIVTAITIGMGVMSFRLSTNGINHAFVSNVPVSTHVDDTKFKSSYREDVKLIASQYDSEWKLLNSNNESVLDRTADKYDAKIAAAEQKATNYDHKYASGEKWAKSQAAKYRKKGSSLLLEKSNALAVLQDKNTKRLEKWRAEKKSAIAAAKKEMKASVAAVTASTVKVHKAEVTNATFWGGLFSWFVGFSVVLAFVCIISVEVYRRGSGIEVEYDEHDVDLSVPELVWMGVSNRWNGFFRKRAEQFAQIAPSSAPSRSIGFDYPTQPNVYAEQEYDMPNAEYSDRNGEKMSS